jgi:hypothetical protein
VRVTRTDLANQDKPLPSYQLTLRLYPSLDWYGTASTPVWPAPTDGVQHVIDYGEPTFPARNHAAIVRCARPDGG